MLEDWVDDAEMEPARPLPTRAGIASPSADAPAAGNEPARPSAEARRTPRTWRWVWFALLGAGLATLATDELPDWVPTELPFGIDGELERWAELFTGLLEVDRPPEDAVGGLGAPPRPSAPPEPVRDEALGRQADQVFAGDNVLPRDAWRAAPIVGSTERLGKPWRITVHHSGGRVLTTRDAPRTARLLRAIQRDHQKKRRWVDIAYHYIVDRAGRVWEGRSSRWVGAHAGSRGANGGNLGILVLGNFDEQSPPPGQIGALNRLIGSLSRRHGIAPERVFTHAEVRESHGMATTDCPGRDLAGWIDAYREGRTEMLETTARVGD